MIGMNSPNLLQLVENCPTGGETLIMRMLYILTEKGIYVGYQHYCIDLAVIYFQFLHLWNWLGGLESYTTIIHQMFAS